MTEQLPLTGPLTALLPYVTMPHSDDYRSTTLTWDIRLTYSKHNRIRIHYTPGRTIEEGAVFKNNRSQAVRLPKPVALPDGVTRVDIVAVGRTRILTPARESWNSRFDGDSVSADFMSAGEPQRENFDAEVHAQY